MLRGFFLLKTTRMPFFKIKQKLNTNLFQALNLIFDTNRKIDKQIATIKLVLVIYPR